MECVAQRHHIGKGWAVGCAYQQREKVVSPECKADVGFFSFLLFFFSLSTYWLSPFVFFLWAPSCLWAEAISGCILRSALLQQ